MFENILAFAEQAEMIYGWLPAIIKTGTFIVIAMIFAISLIIFGWIIRWAVARAR
jgi:hypothetical protein